MKVRALARISGRPGDRDVGDEFEVDAELGAGLIARGLVAEVIPKAAKAQPPAKPAEPES